MKLFMIILILIALSAAQQPMSCTSPPQWEGRIIRNGKSIQFFEYGKMSYDETNKRARIIEEREEGSERDYYDTLYLHNIGRRYRLNLKTRVCNVSAEPGPFLPYSVPAYAKFIYEAEVGAAGIPNESLIAQIWEGVNADGSKFETTVTKPDCVTIHHVYYSNATGYMTVDFFDLNLGISDPTVFIPPTECIGVDNIY